MSKMYRICPKRGGISAIVGYASSVFRYGSAKVAKTPKHWCVNAKKSANLVAVRIIQIIFIPQMPCFRIIYPKFQAQ